MEDGKYKICFSSFIMLITEITREYDDMSISRLLNNNFHFRPLKIIDLNLIKKLNLQPVDIFKRPKILIGLLIRGIWEKVKEIDESFTSMYHLPFDLYPKVADPENLIAIIKNARAFSKNPAFLDPSFLKRLLDFISRKQKIEELKLKVINGMPFIKALEELEDYVLKNKESV
jgi:hypothetical protein